MRKEDKDLLLKDLSSRLPYGVKCENFNHIYGKNIFKVTDIRDNGYICGTVNNQHCWAIFNPLELKPYLFPLSSMAEEQKEFLRRQSWCIAISTSGSIETTIEGFDWLNKNHFDYRGIIEKGLAIDATGLNIYKEETK